jgi:hypothetical protein
MAVSIGSRIRPERAKAILSGGGFRVKVIELEGNRSQRKEDHR